MSGLISPTGDPLEGNKIPQWLVYTLIAAIGWMGSAWVGYSASQAAMNSRVSVLESRSNEIERRLNSIENKIDVLLQRSSGGNGGNRQFDPQRQP